MNAQNLLAEKQEAVAMARYNQRYDNHLYQLATQSKSNQHANALINEAMAICGSPYYKLSRRRWSSAALDFLTLFS